MNKLKVVIIGLKHLHPITYLPHLKNADMEVIAIAEDDKSVIELKRKNIPSEIPLFTDYKEAVKSGNVDIAIIFAPLDENPEIVKYLAAKKINLVVEKPLAASLKGGLDILKYCEENNIIASIPYAWRYHGGSKEIKRILDCGYIGKIQSIEGRCIAGRIDRYIEARSEWILKNDKAGGGAMWNLGCHWIDLFRWFMDFPEVERVYAEYSNFSENIDIEENSTGVIKFKNGVVSTLNIGYSSPPSFPFGRDLHINIRGTLGTIIWSPAFEGMDDEIFICSDHPEYYGSPNRTIKLRQKPTDGYAGMMGFEYLKDFAGCVRNQRKPFVTIQDGVEVLKIADGLNRAAKSKSVVII